MDGAIDSGEEAADQVMEAFNLRKTDPTNRAAGLEKNSKATERLPGLAFGKRVLGAEEVIRRIADVQKRSPDVRLPMNSRNIAASALQRSTSRRIAVGREHSSYSRTVVCQIVAHHI